MVRMLANANFPTICEVYQYKYQEVAFAFPLFQFFSYFNTFWLLIVTLSITSEHKFK